MCCAVLCWVCVLVCVCLLVPVRASSLSFHETDIFQEIKKTEKLIKCFCPPILVELPKFLGNYCRSYCDVKSSLFTAYSNTAGKK